MPVIDSASLLSAAATFLTLMFIWAGLAKIFTFRTTRQDFATLGLPDISSFAAGVILGELAISVLLQVHTLYGAYLAIAALAAYTTIIARAVRSPRTATCSCFGGLRGNREVSLLTIVRNILLLSLAVFTACLA